MTAATENPETKDEAEGCRPEDHLDSRLPQRLGITAGQPRVQ